ncbi:MAG: protein kinase [Gammaproteobacteria bacterium]|nr:protein kinase [Gammaproteobacteria bacterium]MBP9729716.1 protein kinase [Gammaproteobacteria bacterium]
MRQQEQKELLLLQVASLKGRIEAIVHPAPSVQPGLKNTVSYYDLPFEGKIAEGSFATVYQGFLEDHLVAIKTLRGTLKPTEAQRFIREVAIMSDLRYPQITVFYGACLEQSYACLVMEYMAQGSLSKVLAEQDLSLEQKKSLALDVANALHHLHQKNILHRDLKTSNVLINAAGVAKLSDFGLSKPDSTQLEGYGRLGERETIQLLRLATRGLCTM